jgi:hypothetical protein
MENFAPGSGWLQRVVRSGRRITASNQASMMAALIEGVV